MITNAHIQYNNHVKESLLAGKPIEYNLKDFVPKNENKKTKNRIRRSKYERLVYDIFKKAKEIFPNIEKDMWARHSYIKTLVMEEMTKCNTIEEARELYNTYQHIVYNTPIYKY